MSTHQNYISNAGLDLPKDFDLSTESISVGFIEFIEKMANDIRRVTRKVLNTAVIIEAPTPRTKTDFESIIGDYEWGKLRKLRAFVPSKMRGHVGDHLDVLEKQLESLITIEERLLDPLLKFLAEAVASKAVLEQTWVDKNLSLLDTDSMKKKLERTFEAEKINANVPFESNYENAYGNKQEVYKVADRLRAMLEKAGSVDLGIVAEKEKRIADAIDFIINDSNDIEINKQVIVKVANAVQSAAIELEYIAAVFYYTVVNITSLNETYDYTKLIIKS